MVISPSSASVKAGPAMSRCAHGMPSDTKLDKNSPAVRAPPWGPPMFFMSAHRRVELALVIIRQRQPPHPLAGALGGVGQLVHPRLVVAHESGHLRTQSHHARPGEGGQVNDGVGFGPTGQRQGVGQHQPALASVLSTSTVLPLAMVSTSPGRVASPPSMLSVMGT